MARSLARFGNAPVCPRPTYSGVLAGDVVGGLVQILCVGAGAAVGGLVTRSPGGAFVGAGVGFLGGVYPSLAAQRSATRSKDCPQPGMGRLLGYLAARSALGALASTVVAKAAPDNKLLPTVAGTAVFFGGPVLGKALLKT